jgi:hypothetical protein
MKKGRIFLYVGFILGGAVGGLAARYVFHNLTNSLLLIGLGGVIVGGLTFVLYVAFLTKIGK